MKKFSIVLALFMCLFFKAKAELLIDLTKPAKQYSETIKLTKEGILLGEYGYNSTSMPFNGVYLDNSGNLNFSPKVLGSYKITDLDEDANFYYATTNMSIGGKQGLFKISKDFSKTENIGFKAALKKVYEYKDKVYVGGTTYGCYVVNKDGSGIYQILGDGYYGPYIDDIKGNSKNVYVLSRGLLYKVNYETNQKEQLIFGARPAFIEVDDERIYLTTGNKFYYLSFDNTLSNEKLFPNSIYFLKKYKDLIVIAEGNSTNLYFWFSNDNGKNFYKSKTTLSAYYQIKNLEITGDKNYTLYFNLSNLGVVKGNLNFDFANKNLFEAPFQITESQELIDKITSFFDHRYPYLGNLEEPDFAKNKTLNFDGKELPVPYMYYSSHDGIDWGLPLNTPVFSVMEGTASYFYQPNGLGHAIKISHPNGYISIYGHLSNKDLITTSSDVYVSTGQKIGLVGMSGNTSGPHLHFTTYLGEKILNNKIDPFGWNGNFTDPWSEIGKVSSYLWKNQATPKIFQANLSNNNLINSGLINITTLNLIQSKIPFNFELHNTSPIFDFKNYLYNLNTSYLIKVSNLENETTPSNTLGILQYSGFNSGDDKNYSIWRVTSNNVEKMDTSFNSSNKSLSTLFEPGNHYLVLKNNYKKITVKNKSVVK